MNSGVQFSQQPQTRRWRFSLSAIFVAFVLAGAFLAVVAWARREVALADGELEAMQRKFDEQRLEILVLRRARANAESHQYVGHQESKALEQQLLFARQQMRAVRDMARQGADIAINQQGEVHRLTFSGTFDEELLGRFGLFGHLNSLDLSGSNLGDEGAERLRNFRGLQWLILDDTAVTDATLKHLFKLRNLRGLSVARTQVTSVGIADLQRALPRLSVNTAEPPRGGEE